VRWERRKRERRGAKRNELVRFGRTDRGEEMGGSASKEKKY